jgi:acetyl esterase/lipase
VPLEVPVTDSLRPVDRRRFLGSVAAATALARPAHAEARADREVTYDYKVVGDCRIKADVYGATRDVVRPGVIWIHGGALIMGHRGGVDRALLDGLIAAGYVVVSIDYRLAPEVKVPAIIEDVRDACRWVRERGPELFRVAPDRIAVMGASAGGYLTLVSGYAVEPRPKALVAYYGYGDIAGAWYSRPDPFYRTQPLVPDNEARTGVGGAVRSETAVNYEGRRRFYLYCRQQGLWPKEVAGIDPDKEPKAFDPLCPIRNVTTAYPPTLLIHGTKDTDVPYEQSETMDRELTRKGVKHELITVPGAGHGLVGVDPAVVAGVRRRVLSFLANHLGGR